jgi:hypothetical protein
MKPLIEISLDNSAFNGKDCGCELARILEIVAGRVDLEAKSDLIRGYHGDPKSLFDINGNRVGSMENVDD